MATGIYPSIEDMKVDEIQQAEIRAAQSYVDAQQRVSEQQPSYGYPSYPMMGSGTGGGEPELEKSGGGDLASMYPSLMDDYMGMRLEPPTGPIAVPAPRTVATVPTGGDVVSSRTGMIAPLSGNDLGMARATVTHGIRQVIVCKDAKGKVGLRLRDVNKGVFIQFVAKGSPSALAGLRFGDQVLQVNEENVAGYSGAKTQKLIEKAKNPQRILLAVRDRPFERTVTLQKDSTGHVGFSYKDGEIVAIAKETSAARNGLLIEHQILEVNGQNVIGLKDKELGKILDSVDQIVTLTVMPKYIYDHMIKCMGFSLVTKSMDHSIPEV